MTRTNSSTLGIPPASQIVSKTQRINPDPLVKNSSKDESDIMPCMICWETDTSENDLITLPCQHGSCSGCISDWIRRCEKNGLDHAGCPHCRRVIAPNDTLRILGRPYQRVSQEPMTTEEALLVDDLTQDWLDSQDTHQCIKCGMWTVREEADDQVDAVACVCGHIHCWTCNGDADGCDCEHDDFLDPTMQDNFPMYVASRFPVATHEDMEDLQGFMDRRRTAMDEYQYERCTIRVKEESADYVFLTSVFDECTEPADYVFLTSFFDEFTEDATGVFNCSIFDNAFSPNEIIIIT